MFTILEIYDVAILPIIMGIVEVFKRIGLPSKYSPLIAVALGIVISIFYLNLTIKEEILIGVILGLSASGLYSGSKNLVEDDRRNK